MPRSTPAHAEKIADGGGQPAGQGVEAAGMSTEVRELVLRATHAKEALEDEIADLAEQVVVKKLEVGPPCLPPLVPRGMPSSPPLVPRGMPSSPPLVPRGLTLPSPLAPSTVALCTHTPRGAQGLGRGTA